MAPTNAHIVLDAVQAAVEADILNLQHLSQKYALKPELVLRIVLTFLPEGTEPSSYIPLLQDIATGLPEIRNEDPKDDVQVEKKQDEQISPAEARKRVKNLRLLPLTVEDHIESWQGDSLPIHLVSFILLRARRIDTETGSLPMVQELLEPFVEESAYLKLWMGTTILPLLRLNYEIYPERDEPVSLEAFEDLRGGAALDLLVGGGTGKVLSSEESVRDLRQIAGPWLQGEIYRRRARQKTHSTAGGNAVQGEDVAVSSWGWINNWLLHTAERTSSTVLSIVNSEDWKGPGDIDDGGWIGESATINNWIWQEASANASKSFREAQSNYARTRMCLFYTIQGASEETFTSLERIVIQTAETAGHKAAVVDILHNDIREPVPSESFFQSAKPFAHRMRAIELLGDQNPLTNLSLDSMVLAAWYLKTSFKLLNLDAPLPVSKVVETALLGTSTEQRGLLQRYLQVVGEKNVSDDSCRQIYENVVLLQSRPCSSAGKRSGSSYGIWGQIDSNEIAVLFLKALISAGRFKLANSMYLSEKQLLPRDSVEEYVLSVALEAFDSATNGNRTRGGMKKASDIIAAFSSRFSASTRFSRFEALLRSTHALSFYSLTLQHGVPCAPVNLRTQTQPLTLIDKVLSQNSDAYTSLDDLARIASDLVRSGLLARVSGRLVGSQGLQHPAESSSSLPVSFTSEITDQEAAIQAASQTVASKAIRAALEAGDFDTAYSYITTRLAGKSSPTAWEAIDDENTLWRTALAAGRFEPPNGTRGGSSKHLRRLEQKMELLASALELAPPAALGEVLEAWQECEAQVNAATAKEAEAETAWDDSGDKRASLRMAAGDRHLPGGFGSDSWIPNAEGTGGRKWAGGDEEAPMGLFDVARGAAAALQKNAFAGKGQAKGGRGRAQTYGEDDEEHGGQDRVRKRDMVSNAVTSGLVSGIGWVIGASPAQEK